MTVKESFDSFGGDYDEALSRFMDEKRVKKFIYMFLNDPHFDKLTEALEASDWNEAFMDVHTLKGVAANLSLTALCDEAKVLTELLRGGECREGTKESYERLKNIYTKTVKAIEELKMADGV